MANPKAAETAAALRMLPSTDELLSTSVATNLLADTGRTRLTALAREALESLRKKLLEQVEGTAARANVYSRESLLRDASLKLHLLWQSRRDARLRKVINATGVVIHTNLGRAPLSSAALRAIENAGGYCTLEYDLTTGKRGRRGAYVESLIADLVGSEAALIVNNCAAAAFLVLTVFARGGEVIVSRGELVEIGGDFRIPDVLTQSGATLHEVGTTNRTKISDYEKAVNESTRMVMSVHPSNYRIVGFTEKPARRDLAELSHRKGVLFYEDAGSGAMGDLSDHGLTDEPVIGDVISEGADIVTFSGDKLLGGSQAGIIVGRRDLIEQVRRHSLYRALRVDKLIYAALEATVESYLRETAEQDIPVMRMLGLDRDAIAVRTREVLGLLRSEVDDRSEISLEIVDGESVIGGGSAPAIGRPTVLLAIKHGRMSATDLEAKLRSAETPVIARIENDVVLLDLRTVDESDEDRLIDILKESLRD